MCPKLSSNRKWKQNMKTNDGEITAGILWSNLLALAQDRLSRKWNEICQGPVCFKAVWISTGIIQEQTTAMNPLREMFCSSGQSAALSSHRIKETTLIQNLNPILVLLCSNKNWKQLTHCDGLFCKNVPHVLCMWLWQTTSFNHMTSVAERKSNGVAWRFNASF